MDIGGELSKNDFQNLMVLRLKPPVKKQGGPPTGYKWS